MSLLLLFGTPCMVSPKATAFPNTERIGTWDNTLLAENVMVAIALDKTLSNFALSHLSKTLSSAQTSLNFCRKMKILPLKNNKIFFAYYN